MMSGDTAGKGLRIVAFHNLPPIYQMVARWAEGAGHTIALVVTTPGPSTRRTTGYKEIAASAPPKHDVLVTTRLRKVALPLIAALEPDLILSATFPYRLPPELLRIPRLGAINVHPTPLPAYRGPNPLRVFYDGATIGVTAHRMDDEFDTGPILSQHTAPFPEDATQEQLRNIWVPLIMATLAEGVARMIAGDPGRPQDHTLSSYAPEFTEEDYWLDWDLPMRVVQRRASALSFFGPRVKAVIAGQPYRVLRVDPLVGSTPTAAPGTVLDRADGGMTIAVADGAVRVVSEPLEGAAGQGAAG
jgi:methionyl-tRNA formyltransferase